MRQLGNPEHAKVTDNKSGSAGAGRETRSVKGLSGDGMRMRDDSELLNPRVQAVRTVRDGGTRRRVEAPGRRLDWATQ
jgi:hypothetical protein